MRSKIIFTILLILMLCSCAPNEPVQGQNSFTAESSAIAATSIMQTTKAEAAGSTAAEISNLTTVALPTPQETAAATQVQTATLPETTTVAEQVTATASETVITEESTIVAETSVIAETVVIPETTAAAIEEQQEPKEPVFIRLGFAGDFKTAEGESNTAFMDAKENGIFDCISPNLIEEVNSFDFFMLNNEFTYSDRGAPMKNKTYTFRAKPERVNILHDLGVDLVLLANNHVFDYGEEAFFDTMSILQEAGVDYLGAGKDKAEAQNILYYTFDETVISFIGASRAEKYRLTPVADEDSPGVFGIYNEDGIAELLALIETARQKSDFCIVSLHWGTEYSNYLDDVQQELAHRVIDAGADAVIGSHAHVLQGIEIYKDKPIIYNLGNFWFNGKWLYSGVFELTLNATEGKLTGVRFIPCTQRNFYTNYPEDEEGRAEILDFMSGISFDIEFDEMGNILYDFAGSTSDNLPE